jgi:hypothetical protein
MLRYQLRGYAAGFEYSHFETKYTAAPFKRTGNQAMLSGMYFF